MTWKRERPNARPLPLRTMPGTRHSSHSKSAGPREAKVKWRPWRPAETVRQIPVVHPGAAIADPKQRAIYKLVVHAALPGVLFAWQRDGTHLPQHGLRTVVSIQGG